MVSYRLSGGSDYKSSAALEVANLQDFLSIRISTCSTMDQWSMRECNTFVARGNAQMSHILLTGSSLRRAGYWKGSQKMA